MKLIYLANVRIPTSRAQGYAIMKMCEQFAAHGADVELVIPNKRNNEAEKDPYAYYRIDPIFPIIKIKSIDLLGTYEALTFTRLFFWIDYVSFLISCVWRKKADVVYTRDYLIALLFPRTQMVCLEIHQIPASKFLFRKAIKKPRLFIVLNDNLKKSLIDMGVEASRIHVFASGVEMKEFNIDITKEEARKRSELPADKNIVMYTGHLYSWKGVDTLAQAAGSLPETCFVFIGGIEPELGTFKERYKHSMNIIVRPFVQREKIPEYLKAADILVIPNSRHEKISAQYTSPLKLFEYMASQRPIVVSDLSSMRATLNERNAFFAEADESASFSKVIQSVFEHKEKSAEVAEQAFKDVEKYSWQKRAQDILSLIKTSAVE
jgi:glycosyltransferase involved in cell wall biosynthesis